MTLYLDTSQSDYIIIELRGPKKLIRKKIRAPKRQGEKLLPALAALLAAQKIKLSALKKIIVADRGGSFTSLRIGVVTANALAYALNIPVEAASAQESLAPATRTSSRLAWKKTKKFASHSLVEPLYERPPQIGKPAKALV